MKDSFYYPLLLYRGIIKGCFDQTPEAGSKSAFHDPQLASETLKG